MSSRRGAVLVESALALPLILFFTYGSIQLGMVGLEQLTVDGGAFASTHQQALLGANLNNYASGPQVAKAALPHLNASTMSVPNPTLGPPPKTEFVDTYNVQDTNARHGGVSMIEPVQAVGFATSTNFASLLFSAANNITVSGVAIDPAFRLINGHGDVAGKEFGSAGSLLTASDPLVDGNNAPPYFIGFNFMSQCLYTLSQNPENKAFSACPKEEKVGLGLAEYLDADNWGRPLNGVVPAPSAVFYETRLHEDKFFDIAADLQRPNVQTGNVLQQLLKRAAILDPMATNGATACVYSFDNENIGSYYVGTRKIGDYPLDPGGDPVKCAGP